jgi:hypothetical protein
LRVVNPFLPGALDVDPVGPERSPSGSW